MGKFTFYFQRIIHIFHYANCFTIAQIQIIHNHFTRNFLPFQHQLFYILLYLS